MSYSTSYSTVPTFTNTSIGYTTGQVAINGNVTAVSGTLPTLNCLTNNNSANTINYTQITIPAIGVWLIEFNIFLNVSQNIQNFWFTITKNAVMTTTTDISNNILAATTWQGAYMNSSVIGNGTSGTVSTNTYNGSCQLTTIITCTSTTGNKYYINCIQGNPTNSYSYYVLTRIA